MTALPLNIAILGAGESGTGAALLAQKQGHAYYLSDLGPLTEAQRSKLKALPIDWEEGHDEDRILSANLIVKSPGIPGEAPLLQKALCKGITVVSEIEYAARYCEGSIVAITGTNGKTTTASLLYQIMRKAGLKARLAGNVGKSFAGTLALDPGDYYSLEVSSFQLDDIEDFKPKVAIWLNITPDHLDRYQNRFENYVAAKARIFENQDENDCLIYNHDDPVVREKARHSRAQKYPFSLSTKMPEGAWLENEKIIIKTKHQETMKIDDLALQGKHNTYNSMAAGLAGRLLGIRKETIRECLAGFDSIEHRLEHVLKIYGIDFINDSKATNVNSTWYALESMQTSTIWLAGGVDKGNDYDQLKNLAHEKVKALVCIGADNEKLKNSFAGKVPLVIEAADMDEAVRIAYKLGEKGDSVLLSPACASFDLYENYEDRGRQFKTAVRKL